MLFGRYVWSPKICLFGICLVYYLLSGMLFWLTFGKRRNRQIK